MNRITDMLGDHGTQRPASLTRAMTSKLKTLGGNSSRGRGHIVAAPLQGTQLVIMLSTLANWPCVCVCSVS